MCSSQASGWMVWTTLWRICRESSVRPTSRMMASNWTQSPCEVSRPATVGIILAAGASRRFGRENKLLTLIDGIPVLDRTVAAFSPLDRVVVVTTGELAQQWEPVDDRRTSVVVNPDSARGLSSSLRLGIEAIGDEDIAVVGPADQPLMDSTLVRLLVRAWERKPAPAVVPTYRGKVGAPVLFHKSLFPELVSVTGDVGGRVIARQSRHLRVPIEPVWQGFDLDHQEEVTEIESLLAAARGSVRR
jgi:molybdenum cofactor cytidylyltransferase